jgi:hypothetical protein
VRAAIALLAVSCAFLAGFVVLRERSPARATLRHRETIAGAAAAAGVEPGVALALCYERGGIGSPGEIEPVLREYLGLLARFRSDTLALGAFAGERSAVEECLAQAGGDAERAAELLLRRREGMAAVRLQSMARRLPLLPGG